MCMRCGRILFGVLIAALGACAGPTMDGVNSSSPVVNSPLPSLLTALPSSSSSSPSPAPSPVVTPSNVPMSPAPTAIESILTASQVWPVAWSPDGGALIAVDQTPDTSIVHVFAADGHEIWSTPGLTAAWTGADSLEFLRASDTLAGHSDLFEVTLPSGTPTKLDGSYLNFITAAADGRLAVPTSETPRGYTFDLLNPAGGHFDGEPLLWNPASDELAIVLGSAPHSGSLAIVDGTSGSVTRTGLDVDDQPAFDRTGSELMVCVFGDHGNCAPTLVRLDGSDIAASAMRGPLLGAGELPDGRWIGGNSGIVLWDPSNPTTTTSLGNGWPSVSPTGILVIIGDETASPPPGSQVTIVRLPGSGASYPVWSPAGDRIAYSVLSAFGQELRISSLPGAAHLP